MDHISPNKEEKAALLYFYLTKKHGPDFHNNSVLILSTIIKHIMASASKTKLTALFYGCKESIPLCITLEDMGHPQPGQTPVTTDNSTVVGLTMDKMVPNFLPTSLPTLQHYFSLCHHS